MNLQMKEVAEYCKYDNNISSLKAKVTKTWLTFQRYRNVVGWWVCFTSSVGALSFSLLWKWNYTINMNDLSDDEKNISSLFKKWLWWFELMCLIQPIMAVGSYDVDYIWDTFKEVLIESLESLCLPFQQKSQILQHCRSGA